MSIVHIRVPAKCKHGYETMHTYPEWACAGPIAESRKFVYLDDLEAHADELAQAIYGNQGQQGLSWAEGMIRRMVAVLGEADSE